MSLGLVCKHINGWHSIMFRGNVVKTTKETIYCSYTVCDSECINKFSLLSCAMHSEEVLLQLVVYAWYIHLYNIHKYDKVQSYCRVNLSEKSFIFYSKISSFLCTHWSIKERKARFLQVMKWSYMLTPISGKLMKSLKFWLYEIVFLLNFITF